MKKFDKKAIMCRLDKLMPDGFECKHIYVTFPDDNTVRIELSNNPEISEDMKQRIIDAARRAIERSHEDLDAVDRTEVETQVLLGLLEMIDEPKG